MCYNSLLHYAKLAVNGQPIVVWEELSPTCDGPRKPFLQTLAGAFEVWETVHDCINTNGEARFCFPKYSIRAHSYLPTLCVASSAKRGCLGTTASSAL